MFTLTPREALETVIRPALALLPAGMTSDRAEVLLIAIALQESRLANRWQVVDLKHPERKGPARGLWQFELKGGVRNTLMHAASHFHAERICKLRGVTPEASAVHVALETDDILAACFARLLLFTDPKPLPLVMDTQGAWDYYRRVWRPGRPHIRTWSGFHLIARTTVNP